MSCIRGPILLQCELGLLPFRLYSFTQYQNDSQTTKLLLHAFAGFWGYIHCYLSVKSRLQFSLIPRPLPFFALWFAFSIIHRSSFLPFFHFHVLHWMQNANWRTENGEGWEWGYNWIAFILERREQGKRKGYAYTSGGFTWFNVTLEPL